jgi:apolipoprotein N-acyltransferase
MIRCANTGITCVIDPLGRVLQKLASAEGDTFAEGLMLAEVDVPQAPPVTPYMRFGDLFSLLCLGITLAALTRSVVLPRKHRMPPAV